MAKFLDTVMNVMKLNDTIDDALDPDEDDEFSDETPAQNIRPARREVSERVSNTEKYQHSVRTSEVKNSVKPKSYGFKSISDLDQPKTNVVNFHANVQMEVVVIQPVTYDEAQIIADHIRSQKPVIVNLETLDISIAQRIMDFVSGAVYTLGGNLEKVTQNIFIIAPENVDIAGHFQQELESNGIIPWKK